ncbi:MAG: type II secretion system minor pseudopilin GspH [Pseudomonadota bacterium]
MRRSPSREYGFTLIEVSVVLLIITVLTAVFALNIQAGGKKALKEEARRMNALVRLASEQALLQGRDIGMVVEDNGYQFYLYDLTQQRWLDLSTERMFRARTLPDNMRMEIAIEENSVTWPEPEERDESEEGDEEFVPTPQVLMLASGEITPFDLYFEMDDVEPAFHLKIHPDSSRELIELQYGF